jgi:murein L,D-transpeptidase YafK
MIKRRVFLAGACMAALSACSSKFRSYDGPPVTRVVLYKRRRRLYLLHEAEVLRAFDFELGFAPEGHKQVEGDGRTPEGAYLIDRKNPNSSFHLSVGISYPNDADRAKARALGLSPGGDIFIHGTPRLNRGDADWTAGCIAVTNREIEDIFAMVDVGTPIMIYP